MTTHDTAHYERGALLVFLAMLFVMLGAASIGIVFFSDHEGFWRDQAVKKAIAEQRAAEREFGPVIPTSFNL